METKRTTTKDIIQELTVAIGDAYLIDYPVAQTMIERTAIYNSMVSSDSAWFEDWDADTAAVLVWREIMETYMV